MNFYEKILYYPYMWMLTYLSNIVIIYPSAGCHSHMVNKLQNYSPTQECTTQSANERWCFTWPYFSLSEQNNNYKPKLSLPSLIRFQFSNFNFLFTNPNSLSPSPIRFQFPILYTSQFVLLPLIIITMSYTSQLQLQPRL